MYLSRWEEKALAGEYGEALRLAMRLIVKVGEALGAEDLVPVAHAHASGISYDNIGEPGLGFIRDLRDAGGKASVYATYNPAGISLGLPSPFNVDKRLVSKQMEIIRMLESMGFQRSATCIPYKLRPPRLGEHLAWGESSAVAAANTLYGARTNREAGPLALAAAIAGRTYRWGLHLEENRRPTVLIRFQGDGRLSEPWSGLLGYIIGLNFPGEIPYIDAEMQDARAVISMCAAAAASGNTAMCIVKGFSPEDNGPPRDPSDRLTLTWSDLARLREEISTASIEEAEVFYTGCPHHEPKTLGRILELLERRGSKTLKKPVWMSVPAAGVDFRLVRVLRERNVHVFPGTCPVVARLGNIVKAVATDSLKSAFYLPRRHGVKVAVTSLQEFIDVNG